VLVPISTSLGVTAILRWLIPDPATATARFVWATGLVVCAVVTAVGVERIGRRLLPLVTLLKLSMLFPDKAPSRFSIARTAGGVRQLESRLAMGEADATSLEESRSAAAILSLSVALRSHDRRTRGHAERVRVFTDLLGEELQLPEADRYRLRWAALLHDIGKLTIAPQILNKPGALDDKEWRLMKDHPSEGARIAAPILEWLGPWGHAIVEHHERFDGRGYPAGVGGGSISLAGRIVSVADCYDTMTAARSYKKPMAVWAARRELADCAGSQFDPEVVRAFLSISLPKLLWRTGPTSLLVQLPFLARLQEVGLQSVTAMTQGVAVATVAGVTAMAVAGPMTSSARPREPVRPPGKRAPASAVAAPSPTVTGTATGGASPSHPGPTGVPSPTPRPSTPSSEPAGAPSPSPTPSAEPSAPILPSPTPLPLPSTTPLQVPSVPPAPSVPPVPSVPPAPSVPPIPPVPAVPPLPPLP
jgi:hypothetical protein